LNNYSNLIRSGPKTDTGNRRTSNDPLPPTPGSKQLTPAPAEYLDLNVAGLESGYGTTPATDLDHYGHNHERAHSNQYDKFPGGMLKLYFMNM
jgi:hypothetical protein